MNLQRQVKSFRSQSVWASGVSPADWDPVSLSLHFLQRQMQLAEGRRQVVVHYDLLEEMSVLRLHQLGRPNHLLEVLLLQRQVKVEFTKVSFRTASILLPQPNTKYVSFVTFCRTFS